MSVVFVAGAGTDVGKTYVTASLIRALKAGGEAVAALKPVASGLGLWNEAAFAESDTGRLLAAQGLPVAAATVEACTPWRFKEPLSPDMAAAREGRTVTLSEVMAFQRRTIGQVPAGGVLLVEGVGGVMSPATSDALNLDWIKATGGPVILVTGSYLGAISHCLTACETLKAHSVVLLAVIVSESLDQPVPLAETVAAIQRWCDAPVCFLPRA